MWYAYSIGILSALVLGVGIGAKIIAPTKIVYIDGSGFMVLADDEDDAIKLLREAKEKWNPDGWKIFEPKEG